MVGFYYLLASFRWLFRMKSIGNLFNPCANMTGFLDFTIRSNKFLPEYLASSLLETLTDWLQYIVSHVVAVKNRTYDKEHIYLSDFNSKYSKVHNDLLVRKSHFLSEYIQFENVSFGVIAYKLTVFQLSKIFTAPFALLIGFLYV